MFTNVKTLAQRVLQLRTAKGWTQGQLAAAAGVSQGSIGNIENGTRLDPRATTLTGIAQALGVDAHWLSSAEGEMHRIPYGAAPEPSQPTPLLVNTSPGPNVRGAVPLISDIQAGMYTEFVDNFSGDYGSAELIPTTVPVGQRTFALRVTGDSMSPEFTPGMLLIVEPELDPQPGDYVIAKNGCEETTFKQLVNDGGDWYLKPLNPRYPLKLLGTSSIVGVVRAVEKRFR